MTDIPPPPPENEDEPRYGQRLPGYGSGSSTPPTAPYGQPAYPGQSGQPGEPGQPAGGHGQYGGQYGAPYGQQYPQGGQYGQPVPPGYASSPYGGYGFQPPLSRGYAIASLVLGILALVLFCIPGASVLLGIGALVFGVLALGRVRAGRGRGRGMAIGGLVTGTVGLLLGIFTIMMWMSLRPYFDELMKCSDQPRANQQQCIERVLDQWSTNR